MFKLDNKIYKDIKDIIPQDKNKILLDDGVSTMVNLPCAFDIEVSSYYNEAGQKRACMYAYILGINGKCKIGRTWTEFKKDIEIIKKEFSLCCGDKMIIYVHNLSYEFQFIKDMFTWANVLCQSERTPIAAETIDGIIFKCSYMLSNTSLDMVGKSLTKYPVKKAVGDLDYKLIRHYKTPLSQNEYHYILNDALVVMAYIQEEIERNGDITNIPFTKTGYVRNYFKKSCLKAKGFHSIISNTGFNNVDEYKEIKAAFQGGFTHASSIHVGDTLENVTSYDFTSSYPACMLSNKYPMSYPIKYKIENMKIFDELVKSHNCVFDIEFNNLHATFNNDHYISYSKCWDIESPVVDNGRVVSALKLCITITEIDYRIIKACYHWDSMRIANFMYFKSDYLPKAVILNVWSLYLDKTKLKGVEGEEDNYRLAKEMLNSCYGMCVTDIMRDSYSYDSVNGWTTIECDMEDKLNKYNRSRGRYLFYLWGVYITAYARANLWSAILNLKDDFVYADTDSVKILNAENHQNYFDEYNKYITNAIKKCFEYHGLQYEIPLTNKGVAKPLGVWDYDGFYKKFKTLGAKRYIYIDEQNELHITIAGVSKQNGSIFLKKKFKTIDAIFDSFKNNLVFPAEYMDDGDIKSASGKLTHTYGDIHFKELLVDYRGEIAEVEEMSFVHLEPTSYSLSMSDAFLNFLKEIMIIRKEVK